MNIKKWIKEVWKDIVNNESGQWGALPAWSYPQQPKKTPSWRSPIYSPGGYIPKQQKPPPKLTPPPPQATQPRVTQPTGGGGYQPFDFSKYMSQFQPTGWTPPTLPQAPQVTQAMIAQWQKRARGEAGMQFDPQLLAIQQELEKMLLGAEQAGGGIEPAYQEIADYIKRWQEEETGATQRRYYARGLGRGGGLTEREGEIAEQALKETTAAGTEMARKLSDIESQKLLMMEQAGAKKEEIEVQRGRYTAARSADLEESYRQNQKQLEQQRFANQMQIAQVGMTREAEEFNRWLGTMSAANEIWYREQTLGLERESMGLSAAARAEAQRWQKEQAGTAQERWRTEFEEDRRRWEAEMAWTTGQANVPSTSKWRDLAAEEEAKYKYMDLGYGISPYAYRRQADMPAL